jgi:hypothetical protein
MAECGTRSAASNFRKAQFQAEDKNCPGKLYPTQAQRITHVFRQTGSDLSMEKNTIRSEEIRSDRQIAATYAASAKSSGSIDMEFSAGAFDPFIAAYLGTEWTQANTFATERGEHVAFTATNTIVVKGVDLTNVFAVNGTIKTEGFANSANNKYWTISAIAFASGDTTITTVQNDAVVEAGNVYGAVMDASDVLVSGTGLQLSGGDLVDGGGASVFAAARAAGKLEKGRKVMLQGLGYPTAEIQLTANPADGDQLVINDIVYEFDNDDVVDIGAVKVDVGADANESAANLGAAIMKVLQEKRDFAAVTGVATDTVSVKGLKDALTITTTAGSISINNAVAADATKHGVYTIVAATDTNLTLSPTPNDDANANTVMLVLKGSHAAPPSDASKIVKQTFRYEDDYTDIGRVLSYHGQAVAGVSMEVTAEELIKGSVEFVGTKVVPLSTSEIGNETTNIVIDALSTPLFNATTNVNAIMKDGSALQSTAMSFGLDMKTDIKQNYGIGSYFPSGTNPGSLDITGKLEVYFESLELFDKFYNNQYISLEFTLEDIDGNTYVITVPRVFLSQDKINNGGLNDNVMEEIEWNADLDPVTKTSIIFSRMSSAIPPVV